MDTPSKAKTPSAKSIAKFHKELRERGIIGGLADELTREAFRSMVEQDIIAARSRAKITEAAFGA